MKVHAAKLMLISCMATAGLSAQAPTDGDLAWFAGCWELTRGNNYIEEQWTTAVGGTLLGMSRTVREGSTSGFEFMRIFVRSDTLMFAAQPQGQAAPAEFNAKSWSAGEAMFENMAHDFPQRVSYRAAGSDSLLARIEGEIEGASRGIDFVYTRKGCG